MKYLHSPCAPFLYKIILQSKIIFLSQPLLNQNISEASATVLSGIPKRVSTQTFIDGHRAKLASYFPAKYKESSSNICPASICLLRYPLRDTHERTVMQMHSDIFCSNRDSQVQLLLCIIACLGFCRNGLLPNYMEAFLSRRLIL